MTVILALTALHCALHLASEDVLELAAAANGHWADEILHCGNELVKTSLRAMMQP